MLFLYIKIGSEIQYCNINIVSCGLFSINKGFIFISEAPRPMLQLTF